MLHLQTVRTALGLVFCIYSGASPTWSAQTKESDPPPEEVRLSAAQFREGLKRRGLTVLLEQHLREFPPSDASTPLLLLRDIKLAEYADTTRSMSGRLASLREGNGLLEELIQKSPQDHRRFGWRFTLTHSLLYEEAEPLINAILYRGSTQRLRTELAPITSRALAAIASLPEELTAEYDRIESLPVSEFEALERSGYIQELDLLEARVGYLLLWTLYYDVLPRAPSDSAYANQLSRIVEATTKQPALLSTSHGSSHIQVQALLLVGMTHRLLKDYAKSREHLERALQVAERLNDSAERQRIDWAVRLARMELTRNEIDDNRLDEAAGSLTKFRASVDSHVAEFLELQVEGALLDRSILRARAQIARHSGKSDDETRFEWESWQALWRLTQEDPRHRAKVHSTVSNLIEDETRLTDLDPFELFCQMAGWLARSDLQTELQATLIQKTIAAGEVFLTVHAKSADALIPEVRFLMGVAETRRQRPLDAARQFLIIAREFPNFKEAPRAAEHAVQLLGDLYHGSPRRLNNEGTTLYREALHALVTGFADTKSARYHRFFYAQLLEDAGEFDRADAQYASVDTDHEHFLQSRFARIRCLALALHQHIREHPSDNLTHQYKLDDFQTLQREFTTLATSELLRARDPQQTEVIQELLASARVIHAEILVLLPEVDRSIQALETLDPLETTAPISKTLLGRVWRVRILAYERLGKLEEATLALPTYVSIDPHGSGATLQSLYTTMSSGSDLPGIGEVDATKKQKAETALIIADQLSQWAAQKPDDQLPVSRLLLSAQLAESSLRASKFLKAREIYEALASTTSDPRIQLGYAESLFRLDRFEEALKQFNRLATTLEPNDPIRWQALLRDLQCRSALQHPPDGIIKVIEQQRTLFPGLGGPKFSSRFQQLLRENEQRKSGG
ncbi:MAG: hypothetical protein AABZ47_16515 [Planctomycetota bacterium]